VAYVNQLTVANSINIRVNRTARQLRGIQGTALEEKVQQLEGDLGRGVEHWDNFPWPQYI
jgi:hypothetical protein